MTILEAVHLLDELVDESDPDTDLPNSVHAFQTAERIRADHPDEDWFHLTGLLHDLGKVMAMWGEPQYFVVGDTFPLGCKFSEHIVFPETFKNNPDTNIPEYRYAVYCYDFSGNFYHKSTLLRLNLWWQETFDSKPIQSLEKVSEQV